LSDDFGEVSNNFFYSDDQREGAEFNLSMDSDWFGLNWTTKAGGAIDFRDKEFRRDFNRFSRADVSAVGRPEGWLTLADEPFAGGGELTGFLPDFGDPDDYEFGTQFDIDETREFIGDPGEVILIQTDNDLTAGITDAILKDYAAGEDIYAAYLMETLEWKRWKFIGGMRWERTENTFTTNRVITWREDLPEDVQSALPPQFQFIQPRFWPTIFKNFGQDAIINQETFTRSYDNLLLAFHANRRFGKEDNWVLRAAITQTIARPRYTDLVPREIVGISGPRFTSNATLPNFELRPMESTNLDLSLSYYFEGFGLINVAAYYKTLDGPVYQEVRLIGPADPLTQALTAKYYSNPLEAPDWSTSRMANAGTGNLMGLEVTFEKRFTGLPSPFDGLGISANGTILDSEVELLAEQREGEIVPLFLQSDKLANVSVFYEKYGLLVRMSWVFRGKYLDDTIVAGDEIEKLRIKLGLPANSLDAWVDDYARLDLLVEYRPNENMSLFFEGTNLLNESRDKFFGVPSRLSATQFTEPIYFIGAKFSL
jgi:TonB-dependent receptor